MKMIAFDANALNVKPSVEVEYGYHLYHLHIEINIKATEGLFQMPPKVMETIMCLLL